jgi:hypothetical protein
MNGTESWERLRTAKPSVVLHRLFLVQKIAPSNIFYQTLTAKPHIAPFPPSEQLLSFAALGAFAQFTERVVSAVGLLSKPVRRQKGKCGISSAV